MQTNDHQIRNYDIVLDETFGNPGSPERAKAEEEAYNFYSGQILQELLLNGLFYDFLRLHI